jgi:ABC-type branched-subunit amino acid transport system ATPase component
MVQEKVVAMNKLAQALEVKDIFFKIHDLHILNGVSFSVAKGTTVGIIGPNGSGKTTLFNTLSGFSQPNSGSIYFNGADVTRLSPYERAKKGLGRVFQNFGIFREMTVLENVITALESHQPIIRKMFPWGSGPKRIREEAMGFLEQVGLAGKAKAKAGSLSGGQMRLLEIIRTIAFRAEICLLDEPTAGVSPKMKEAVADLVKHVQGLGKTVLVIEHDINFIQRFADRIIVLDGGKVVLDGTPQAVRKNEMLKEIYFGVANA